MRTLYYNGNVYTGTLPPATAFAVEDGKFIFAGTDEEGMKLGREKAVDLSGKFVMAGFNDSHMHLLNYGYSLSMAHLAEHTDSLCNLLAYLKGFTEAKKLLVKSDAEKKALWIQGRGWNQDYFQDADRMPNRWDLDQVSTEFPIVATRCCGHCLAVNSKALSLLGITKDTPCPPGGRIGLKEGEPDGLFYDDAMSLIHDHLPVPGKEEIKRLIRLGIQALNSYGVTSVQSDDFCAFRSVPWQTIKEAYHELEESGELTVRVYEQSNFTSLEALKKFVEAGNITGKGTDYFKIGPLKMLGDGSLGARTAYLSQPYADDPTTRGIPIFTQEEMDSMIGYAHENGMQVAVHSIGDATMDMVLDAVEKAQKKHPRENCRHGIVHCQVTRADQLERLAKLHMHIYAQSIFLDYDIHIVERLVGKERAATSYSWKTLMEKGCVVSNGTDCPVENPNALAGIQCAVTRTTLSDHVGPYLPKEAFSVKEALDSYTINGAVASFEEDKKGRIAPGFLADFVILDGDPFAVDPFEIKDIPVLATFVGGEKVFSAS